mgnify:CR=1 FL=1
MGALILKKYLVAFSLLLSLAAYGTTIRVGNGVGEYTSLSDAFNAINTGSVTGSIIIEITKSTTEVGTLTLNKTSLPANYSSILIYPTVAGLSITGNVNGSFLVFDGVTNLTIDGRVNQTGAVSLTVTNENPANTATASTVEFKNTAHHNLIKYCNIKGSEAIETSGIIRFSASVSGIGNDYNGITNNNITNTINGRPCNAIYSMGATAYNNDYITIANNNIYDCINPLTNSSAIYVRGYSKFWEITGNSVYEQTSVVPTGDMAYHGILIGYSATATAQLYGFNITGNYIGGTAPLCGGTKLTKTNTKNNDFVGIETFVGPNSATIIDDNVISNITWENSSNATFTGISALRGKVYIGSTNGNVIGAVSGTNAISFKSGGTTNSTLYGVYINQYDSVFCRKNIISALTSQSSNSLYANSIYGIFKQINVTGYLEVSNNQIGGDDTNSIVATSLASSNKQIVSGIWISGTGNNFIDNNVIRNLTNSTTSTTVSVNGCVNGITVTAGTCNIANNSISILRISNKNTGINALSSVIGISAYGTTAAKTITANTILNLLNDNTTFAGSVVGILFLGSTGTNTVEKNFISDLRVNAATTAANVFGLRIMSGNTTYSNNIISLGGNTKTNIYGLYISCAVNNNSYVYNNSISIYGTVAASTNKSYAIYSATNTNIRNFRNNIFSNIRSTTSGTNLHYAIYLNYATSTNLTLDYNDYYVSGTGKILANYASTNKTVLPVFAGSDTHSYNVSPTFINPSGTAITDYKIGTSLQGVSIATVTTDINGAARTIPTIGVWEQVLAMWKGTFSDNWSLASNWTSGVVPGEGADIQFDPATVNNCKMNSGTNRTINNLINHTNYDVVVNGNKLTIKGDLDLNNGGQIDATADGSIIEFAGVSQQTIPVSSLYNNTVDDLIISNANNVVLASDLNIAGSLSSTSGRLDAYTQTPTVSYIGLEAQTIGSGLYLDDKIHQLTIDNAVGVTLNADITVNDLLTINNSKKLIVSTSRLMNVEGEITNNAGVDGILLKSSSTEANGSLIFHNDPGNPVLASVQLTSKAGYVNPNYKWQYIGIPFTSLVNLPTFYGAYVRKYNEAGTNAGTLPTNRWIQLAAYTTMLPVEGYEVCQKTYAVPYTYHMSGQLINSTVNRSLAYTSGAQAPGQHIISNPYTAAIDITQIDFGANMDNAVYLYSTGSYADYLANNGIEGSNPGQYLAVPVNLAGSGGLPGQISSMQGFLVKTSANTSISIPYSSVIQKNTLPMRAKKTTERAFLKINLNGALAGDVMWIFHEPSTTRAYDNGWDGTKYAGDTGNPLIYASEATGNFQINTVPDLNETNITFKSGDELNYTLTFTNENLALNYNALFLFDTMTSQVIDILQSGTQYTFTASATRTNMSNRFKILTYNPLDNPIAAPGVKYYTFNKQLIIENSTNQNGTIVVYNTYGKECLRVPFTAQSVLKKSVVLPRGGYTTKLLIGNKNYSKNLIIE